MKPLSPAMRKAIWRARGANEKLHLHHFGHWFGLISTVKVRGSTVDALVRRGLAEYTKHGPDVKWHNPTHFTRCTRPIEVTLTDKALDIGD